MRGRTNVGGGNGIFVNGDIDFYTIADGNSITAGDFVSRKIIPSIKQLYSTSATPNKGDKVGDNLYLFVVNQYLTLVKFDGKTIEVVYAYTGYRVPHCYYDEETGIIWGTAYIGSSEYDWKIARFEIENEKIRLKDLFSEEHSGKYGDYLGVYEKNNTFIIFSGSSTIQFDCYAVSENGQVARNTFTKSFSSIKGMSFINNHGSRFYVLTSNSGTLNQTSARYINVSETEDEVELKFIRSAPSSYNTVGMATSRVIEKSGKAFFVYSDSSGEKYGSVKICIYDMETENHTEYDILPVNENFRFLEISDFITSDTFMVKINNKFLLLKYSWETNSIEIYSNTIELDNRAYSTCVPLVNQNSIGRFGQYATIFTVDGNTLLAGEDQKIIQPYDKDIGSIGLAKNSGKAGDSIAVYVPR